MIYNSLFCSNIGLYKSNTSSKTGYPWDILFSDKFCENDLYKVLNDSNGDSIINLSSSDITSTLIRFNESINAFESVPNKNDSFKYKLYQENFYKRAKQAFVKAGILMEY